MVWFASSWAAALIYGPAAAAGALLPYVTLRPPQLGIRDLVAGTTLLHALGAAVLAWLGARSAFIHAIWAAGGLASLLVALPVEVGAPVLAAPCGVLSCRRCLLQALLADLEACVSDDGSQLSLK